jgi:hypothetical protein
MAASCASGATIPAAVIIESMSEAEPEKFIRSVLLFEASKGASYSLKGIFISKKVIE